MCWFMTRTGGRLGHFESCRQVVLIMFASDFSGVYQQE